MPTIVLDDGTLLNEGCATLQYIADQNPGTIAPAPGSKERYTTINDLNYVATEVHKDAFSKTFHPAFKQEGAVRDFILSNFDAKMNYLNDVRIAGKEFLSGTAPTIADYYLYIVLGWCQYNGTDLSKYPHCFSYHARMHQRPEVGGAWARMMTAPTTTIA